MTLVTDELVGPIAVLTLRRPKSLNAITEEMIGGIEGALDRHERSDAAALVLTGEVISGEEAGEIGLVTAVAEDALGGAVALAERCAAHGQPVQQALRRTVREGVRLELREAFELERALHKPLLASPESIAAIRGFAKRNNTAA